MIIISHRVNTIEQLNQVPFEYGVELDLRDYNGEIVIQHEPLTNGESFKDYLKYYHHNLMILNVKCEGVEDYVSEMIKLNGNNRYFYLDLSFPALIKLSRKGEKNIAVRFSEYEPVENCLALKGMVEWVWVDCFNHLPLTKETYTLLKKHFKLCIVSPELQKHPVEFINKFREQLHNMPVDAVCTKRPDLWIKD